MADQELNIIIKAKDEFSSEIEKAQGKLESMSAKFKAVGATFTAIGAVGVVAIKSIVDQIDAQNVVDNQLNAVLKSTGEVAGVTKEQVQGLADSFQNTTPFANDVVESGENMLLTFTGIGKAVFPQTTQAMLDMATAMNGGVAPGAAQLRDTAIQLGKALNDPITGMSALHRVGVTFNQTQQDTITKLQNSGNLMGAQQVILAELNKEFGGSATAAASSFGGQIEQITHDFQDFEKELGKYILPILEKLAGYLRIVVDWFLNLSPQVKEVIAYVLLFGTAFFAIIGPILLLVSFLPAVIAGFTALGSIIAFVVSGVVAFAVAFAVPIVIIAALIAIGVLLYTHWDFVKQKATELGQTISKVWNDVKEWTITAWDNIVKALDDAWTSIKESVKSALDFVKGVIEFALAFILGLWGTNFGEMKSTLETIWNDIKSIVETALNNVKENVTSKLNFVKDLWSSVWNAITTFLKPVTTSITSQVSSIWTSIMSIWNTGTKMLSDAWSSVWDGIKKVAETVGNAIVGVVKGIINAIVDGINKFISAVNKIAQAGAVGGLKIPSIPTIPHLANGGIVNSPTVALIGEAGPEAVVPLSGANKPSLGTVINITINGDVSGEEVAEKIGDRLLTILKMHTATV